MKLNAYLAILLAFGLMIGEIIRSYNQHRNWLYIVDDFIMGFFLIVGAILVLAKHQVGNFILIAAWGFSLGMICSSFTSKITNTTINFQSYMNHNLLLFLIGLALMTSLFGLIWSIFSTKNG